jgi:hypothetical protein
MTQPHDQVPGVTGDDAAAAQAERVNHALRGYAVPMTEAIKAGGEDSAALAGRLGAVARAGGVPGPQTQQPRPAVVQPKPKGTVKMTSFLIIVGAITVYVLATHFGWYDQLPSWLDDLK